jgi:hypothetical protein
VLGVLHGVTPDDHRLRAKLPRHSHGHSGANACLPSLVAAGGYDPAVTYSPYKHGDAMKPPVQKALYRHEKAVEVHVEHHPFHGALGYVLVERTAKRVHLTL